MKPSSNGHLASDIRHPTYYTFYHTNCGLGAVIFTNRGIANLILPNSREEVVRQALSRFPKAVLKEGNYSKLKNALLSYFEGKNVKFNFPLDLTGNSLFQKNVFSIAKEIPYSKRRSYRWIADKLGKPRAYRAVGNALGKNPIPIIIPCHRVVREDGSLGGFSNGIGWKRKLLELETKKEDREQKTENRR